MGGEMGRREGAGGGQGMRSGKLPRQRDSYIHKQTEERWADKLTKKANANNEMGMNAHQLIVFMTHN